MQMASLIERIIVVFHVQRPILPFSFITYILCAALEYPQRHNGAWNKAHIMLHIILASYAFMLSIHRLLEIVQGRYIKWRQADIVSF